jgi:hypothetical protein
VNTELLLKVKAHILEEPKRVYMDNWRVECAPGGNVWVWASSNKGEALLIAPSCGTIGCISGWMYMLAPEEKKLNWTDGLFSGAERHDLLEVDLVTGQRLFYSANWPDEFQDRLRGAELQSLAYAQVVADRIDRFIETEGRE